MADFDSFDYDIESRLPEWWKGFGALEPINKYTQELISEILQALLTTMGVVQPLNCWLTIPEEYTWFHHYKATDDYLKDKNGNGLETDRAVTTIFAGNQIHAQLPNTKRNCHAKIQLKLLGTEVKRTEDGKLDKKTGSLIGSSENIDELIIKNDNQQIIIHNVSSTSTIEISTKDNEILVDGQLVPHLIEGRIDKIRPTKKYDDYVERYIDDDGNIQKKTETSKSGITYEKNISVQDENKKTEIIIDSSKTVDFDLQIYLYKPTYTTEQNIRVATVSAFPIEWIRLFGYFCHPFNNKSGYEYLWEKNYTEESRTTFDRITTQYDCERFYIQVKFYGIGVPLTKGFPQEIMATNSTFQLNPNLDKWGKIYNLPRRMYKTNITEDEEPFTFPKYYKYPIEQDYWYEERMVNEYRFDNDAINSLFVKDDEFNNIGMLECIYPFMDDIWVYTETIDPSSKDILKVQNEETDKVSLCSVIQRNDTLGKEWENPEKLITQPISITLNPQSDNVKKLNDFSYQTRMLKCAFCLTDFDSTTPKDITIKGLELKFKTELSIQSNTIRLSEDSKFIIPYPNPAKENNYILEKVNIIQDNQAWMKERGYYTIGGEDNLFGEKKITREQLFKGNDGKVEFELGFINENNFLESILYLENVELNIYYELIPNDYSIDVNFNKRTIDLSKDDDHTVKMEINIANEGETEVRDKEVFIIIPPELNIKDGYNSYLFNLEIGEVIPAIDVFIEPKEINGEIRTGWYDILVICEDKVISNEILVRGSE